MAKELSMADQVNIKNKKASFAYTFIEKFTAGVQLLGTEIKSIRNNKANLSDSFCIFYGNELFIRNLHISEYEKGGYNNHEPKRERKLLLNRKELKKIKKKSEEKGMTIIPTRLFVNQRGLAKLDIALSKGKNTYDKRQDIKTKDMKRELDRRVKM
jgi:SsrA-binding protein